MTDELPLEKTRIEIRNGEQTGTINESSKINQSGIKPDNATLVGFIDLPKLPGLPDLPIKTLRRIASTAILYTNLVYHRRAHLNVCFVACVLIFGPVIK